MTKIESRAWTAGKIIRSMLVSDSASRAFVGDRVYPVVAPEGATLPLAIFRLDRSARDGGHLTGNSGIVTRTYEVAFHGKDYDQVDAFAAGFRLRIESWRGVEGALKVRRIDILDESDEPYDRPAGGSDDPIFARVFVLSLNNIETSTALPSGSYGA